MKKQTEEKDPISVTIKSRKETAENYLSTKRELWDEYEDIHYGRLRDKNSTIKKSQVFDHKLSTMVMDRSARVMAQLQVGKVKAISKNDQGSAKLMNLTHDKYIIPNANAQFKFLIKARMVDLQSNMYGAFPVFIDWDVRKNGYAGPDMWMIPIRDFFPQVGATSVEDSDYCIVRTWQPLSWFEGLKGNKEFKNIDQVLVKLRNKSGDKQSTENKSPRVDAQYTTEQPAKGKGYYEVLSMYEKDRWIDYVTSADLVIRDRKNPQENSELPVVIKYSIPDLNDFFGVGDYERGKSMQYTVNSLWNMYLDSVKVSIFPPTLINQGAIADQSSIKWGAAAKWLINGAPSNAAQVMQLSPQGTQTFNNVYQTVTASLLNMFGTSDTSVSDNVDPGFGKTPQALKMQASRENARDNVDRFYMEQFLQEVSRKFVNLMSKKQVGSIAIRMFDQEIEELAKVYPEVSEMYDEKSGKLKIDKSKTGSILYDYEIVSGSTYAVDQTQQQQNLMTLLQLMTNGMQMGPQGVTSPMMEAVKGQGLNFKLGELIKRITAASGITDWDKILEDTNETGNEEEGKTQIMSAMDNQFAQAIQQMQGMGQIPAQPEQIPQEIPMEGM